MAHGQHLQVVGNGAAEKAAHDGEGQTVDIGQPSLLVQQQRHLGRRMVFQVAADTGSGQTGSQRIAGEWIAPEQIQTWPAVSSEPSARRRPTARSPSNSTRSASGSPRTTSVVETSSRLEEHVGAGCSAACGRHRQAGELNIAAGGERQRVVDRRRSSDVRRPAGERTEHRSHVGPSPSVTAETITPAVVIAGLAFERKHRVDRRTPAHAAAPHVRSRLTRARAPGEETWPCTRRFSERRVEVAPTDRCGSRRARVVGPGLEHEHTARLVLRQTGGDDGPGRPGADNDVIPSHYRVRRASTSPPSISPVGSKP